MRQLHGWEISLQHNYVHVRGLSYFVDLTGRQHVGDFLYMQRRCRHAALHAWLRELVHVPCGLQMLTFVHTGPQAIRGQMGGHVLHARRAPTRGGQEREPAPPARRIQPRPQPVLCRLLVCAILAIQDQTEGLVCLVWLANTRLQPGQTPVWIAPLVPHRRKQAPLLAPVLATPAMRAPPGRHAAYVLPASMPKGRVVPRARRSRRPPRPQPP
jgi:hypothetical protein